MESTELRIGNLVNYQEGTSKKQGFIYCINYTTATVGNTIERYTVKLKNIEYKKLLLNVDFTREEFIEKFGSSTTFPKVLSPDGTLIGGATETVNYLKAEGLL